MKEPGFVGHDGEGRLLHYCRCGAWGSHGYNVELRKGILGQWYCDKHRPDRPKFRFIERATYTIMENNNVD